MTNMTLAIPEEMKNRMKKFSEIKWSEIARKAMEQRMQELEMIEKIAQKSKLTQEDADELSAKIKKRANQRFLNGDHSRY